MGAAHSPAKTFRTGRPIYTWHHRRRHRNRGAANQAPKDIMITQMQALAGSQSQVDWTRVRADFPILSRTVHGKPLVFLDSTATSQKPQAVLDAMDDYYRTTNANIHRGVYELSEVATDRYEKARARIARFIN